MGTQSPRLLGLPEGEPVRFRRNFIRHAVIEARFPTLLELENSPPTAIQHALRKEFPFYEPGQNVQLGADGFSRQTVYSFHSRDRVWTVGLRSFSLALNTTSYTTFEAMLAQFKKLVNSILGLLDTDFFTRIGMRYQNVLPVGQQDIEGWVNERLVGPLLTPELGDLGEIFQEIRGFTTLGGYLIRHGLVSDKPDREYVIDIDVYAEGIEAGRAEEVLMHFHRDSFAIFNWTLGPKARDHLGPAIRKG